MDTINKIVSKSSFDLMKAENQELRAQLKSLVDRGILVCYKTPAEHSFDGSRYTVSQRIGLKVETEQYIEKIEKELEALREVEEAALEVYQKHPILKDDNSHVCRLGIALSKAKYI